MHFSLNMETSSWCPTRLLILLTSVHRTGKYDQCYQRRKKSRHQTSFRLFDLQWWRASTIDWCNRGTISLWATDPHLFGYKSCFMWWDPCMTLFGQETETMYAKDLGENQILLCDLKEYRNKMTSNDVFCISMISASLRHSHRICW